MTASRHGQLDIVMWLMSHGADVNAQDVSGNTALHYASAYGHVKVIRELMDHGANPLMRNVFSWTPVSYSFSVQVEVAFRGWIAEAERKAGGGGGGGVCSTSGAGEHQGGGVRLVSVSDGGAAEQGEEWAGGSSFSRWRFRGDTMSASTTPTRERPDGVMFGGSP